MERSTTPQQILDKWAKKPLDFEPGTRWQYSNTGYVVAGLIAEKVSGQPLLAYLHRKIFDPLGMTSVRDQDDTNTPAFPAGYKRNALGPVRVAQQPGRGWLYAAGELSMTAADLAKWDIARMRPHAAFRLATGSNRKLLSSTPTGAPTATASGSTIITRAIGTSSITGAKRSGSSRRTPFIPETKDAIIVFTNADFSGATDTLTAGIEKIVLNSPESALDNEGDRLADAQALYAALVAGNPDRSKLTPDLDYYFNPTTLGDYSSSLAPLGQPKIEMKRRPAPSRRLRQPQLHASLCRRKRPDARYLRGTGRRGALGAVHDHAGVTAYRRAPNTFASAS